MSTRKTPGGKDGRCRKSRKSGARTYRILKGLFRPVAEKLNLLCFKPYGLATMLERVTGCQRCDFSSPFLRCCLFQSWSRTTRPEFSTPTCFPATLQSSVVGYRVSYATSSLLPRGFKTTVSTSTPPPRVVSNVIPYSLVAR